MVHFYGFPREIRLTIYKECLVVGEIYPYSLKDPYPGNTTIARDNPRCDLPAVALLEVSKTIRKEAEPSL